MGYGDEQRRDLKQTIERAAAAVDVVVVGTPIDLARVLELEVPSVQVFYDLQERTGPTLAELLTAITGR